MISPHRSAPRKVGVTAVTSRNGAALHFGRYWHLATFRAQLKSVEAEPIADIERDSFLPPICGRSLIATLTEGKQTWCGRADRVEGDLFDSGPTAFAALR